MNEKMNFFLKKCLLKTKMFFITYVGKWIISLLVSTCKIHVEGVDRFLLLTKQQRCLLMLWHNRIAIVPCLLSKFTPQADYAAVISASRDGELLNSIVKSYKNGYTIRVGHQSRYQALRELIRHVKEEKSIVVITPDGPRGPRYKMKPGTAVAALETKAQVVALNWEADAFWEFSTWDRLRLPKPFTTIYLSLGAPTNFNDSPQPSLEEAIAILNKKLPLK